MRFLQVFQVVLMQDMTASAITKSQVIPELGTDKSSYKSSIFVVMLVV